MCPIPLFKICYEFICLILNRMCCSGRKGVEKRLKIVAEKLASKEKSRTFALPFEKRVVDKARSS